MLGSLNQACKLPVIVTKKSKAGIIQSFDDLYNLSL